MSIKNYMKIEYNANSPTNNKSFFTIEDLANIFSVSKPTIYKLVERRVLPFYKIGGSIRFFKSDIEEYLNDVCVIPIVKCK